MSYWCRQNHSLVLSVLLLAVLQSRPLQAAVHHAAAHTPLQHFTAVRDLTDTHSPHSRMVRQVINTPPMFDQLHYTASVIENSPIGTEVDTVQAHDSDEGSLGELTYSMQPDSNRNINSANFFRIAPSTGVITTTASIDRERTSSYAFQVTAHDGGGMQQMVHYTIQVLDENDNSPTFQAGSYYNTTVQEDHATGSQILDITVIDEDAGGNGLVSYQLLNNTGGVFGIRMLQMQAQLRLERQLDYETLSYYLLTLIAMDGGSPAHTTSANIEVFVSDVADSVPQFNASSYRASVSETTAAGSYILTVNATSQDSAPLAAVNYDVLGGNPSGTFYLDPITGVLTLMRSLDFEAQQQFALTVQAQSQANFALRTQATVFIVVVNVNDHYPTFSRSQYTSSISEGATAGQRVTRVSAEDLDGGAFGDVTYHINSSDASVMSTFILDSLSGIITTAAALDREQQEQYSFTVVAQDGGTPPLTGQVRVVVRVSDVNDMPPVFGRPEYHASVPENVTTSTTVLQVSAMDSDSETTSLEYFIQSGNVRGAFYLDPTDGLLTVHMPLNREERALYILEVVASDGLLESSVTVNVTVTDVNDHPPVFNPNFFSVAVSESLPVGSTVVQVRAMDADSGANGMVTYTSDASSEFAVNNVTGAVTLRTSLDYELMQFYRFTIVASDGGSPLRTATARVVVNVQDENDNRPTFEPGLRTGGVQENLPAHTMVLQLTATDADSGSNEALSYSIIADSRAVQAFTVDSSGVVYTRQPLDREVQAAYSVTVQVSDNGRPSLSSTTVVSITIIDVVDYPPVFTQVTYEVFITRETPQNTVLITPYATTQDTDSSILYAITSGANTTLFNIAQRTGRISSVTSLNPRTHAGVFVLRVTAQHRHLSESVPVIITIMEDDGIPLLGPLTVYFNVYPSFLQPTQHLGRVRVRQRRDDTLYTFSLCPSSPLILSHFTIGHTTGEISVSSSVPSGYYTLNVSVTTATGTGYGAVEVYVHIIGNSTLESAVVVVFSNARETSFASIQLERFAQFLTEIVPCSRRQVEIIGVQHRGPSTDEIVEVAFAVQRGDQQGYVPPDAILDRLWANEHLATPSTLLQFGSDVCVREPCPLFQQCRPELELYRYSSEAASRVLMTTDRFYWSHPFAQSHSCYCPDGFSRDEFCSNEINECDRSPCLFGAACKDLVGDYRCNCPEQTLGKNCSVVCPSSSCQPCSPSPCLHGSSCAVSQQDPSVHICTLCPWRSEYRGPNCELTSLHFTTGSYVAFPPIGSKNRLTLSFRFATIAPSGVLLYSGRVGGLHDFLAVELVIGQLKVGVSLGGEAITMTTDSVWQLNNGQWHTVEVHLDEQSLVVVVTDCSNSSQFLEGATESCQLRAQLPGDSRSLDVNGPLYFGGLEGHMSGLPLSGSSYVGCVAGVRLDGTLLDLASPLRSYGTAQGCPPLDATCSGGTCGVGIECKEVWNGTLCSCRDTCQDAVKLSSGYLQLSGVGASFTINRFSLAFRTYSTGGVLAQFGNAASLELHYGSVVYRHSHSATLSALTLSADAFANDGLWHQVLLEVSDSMTQLMVDGSRVRSSLPEGGVVTASSITLGAQDPSLAIGRLSGCLRDLVVNSIRFSLPGIASSTSYAGFTTTSHGASMGCGDGVPCSGVQCPSNSHCVTGWERYSCHCNSSYHLEGARCVDPCIPNPCQHGGRCHVPPSSSLFQCECHTPYRGVVCNELEGEGCAKGFYSPPTFPGCKRCVCDPRGVQEGVCDGDSGECSCKPGLALFSLQGDLGCQSCDCHTPGSTSPFCDASTGQCSCLPGVGGRRCDRCAVGFAGMDSLGCKAASVLEGSFLLPRVSYTSELADHGSAAYTSLAYLVRTQLEAELSRFGQPGEQEAEVTDLSGSAGVVRVDYRVASFFPRSPPSPISLPSPHTLAAVVQTVVQTGQLGTFHTNSSSHFVHLPCSSSPCDPLSPCYITQATPDTPQPFVCGSCPAGSSSDGVVCRAILPQNCTGIDTDRDNIPDTCDSCPFVFNPSQRSVEGCRREVGVCPPELASGILWSPTSAGAVDSKPCPPPLAGVAVRRCLEGGAWGEAGNLSCVSAGGQEILAQAAALSGRWVPTADQLLFMAASVEELTRGGAVEFGGDLQAVGTLIDRLLSLYGRLGGNASLSVRNRTALLQSVALAASHLLDPDLAQLWGAVGEGYSPADLLRTLEQLANSTASLERESLSLDHIAIATLNQPSEQFSGKVFNLTVNGTTAVVLLPPDIPSSPSSTLNIAVAQLATIGTLLPRLFLFNSSQNLTVAAPLMSVQVWGEGVVNRPLPTPLTLTMEYSTEMLQREGDAVCVFWDYESGGWSRDGCHVLEENATHCTCRCSHLTAFAVLLPSLQPQPPIIPVPDRYVPEVFSYIVLGCVSLLFLATLVLIVCLRAIQSLHTTVHQNLVSALFLATIAFLVGVSRTEVPAVCAAVSVVEVFLLLACLSWLVAEAVLLARLLLFPQPKRTFLVYLIVIGWAFPLLFTGISIGAVGIVSQSFLEDIGYPNQCWLSVGTVWAFVVPALLLLMLYVAVVLVAVVVLVRQKDAATTGGGHTTTLSVVMNNHKIRVSLCVSVVVMALLLLTWVFGLLAVYSHKFFEYAFAILYATLGVFVFIVLCLNSKVREACRAKFRHKDQNASTRSTMGSSSVTNRFGIYSEALGGRGSVHPRGFSNTFSVLQAAHSPPSSFTPTSTLIQITHSDEHLKPHTHVRRSGTLGSEPQPWYSIPEPIPLSPLTCGSDADSEFSPDTENREVEEQQGGGENREEDRRQEDEEREEGEREEGEREEGEREVQDGEKGEENASPSLSELYQRTRGSSPESYLEYSHEEQAPSTPKETEDPLWYRPRDSGCQFDEVVPMPYETAVKPPPSPQRSVKWTDLEREETDADKLQSLASPRHSGVSYCSLQTPPTSPRGCSLPIPPTSPRGCSLQTPPTSPRGCSLQTPPTSPRGVVPPEQLYTVVERRPRGTGSPRKQYAPFQRPPVTRTVSDNLPYSPREHVTRRASETSNHTEPHSLASSGPSSSLQSHAASSLQQSPGHHKSSDQSGTVNDCYHSNGPSVEGRLNQVIRHADGSKTVQSLV